MVAVKRFYGGGILNRQCARGAGQSPRSAEHGFRNSFGKCYHRKLIIAISVPGFNQRQPRGGCQERSAVSPDERCLGILSHRCRRKEVRRGEIPKAFGTGLTGRGLVRACRWSAPRIRQAGMSFARLLAWRRRSALRPNNGRAE